VPNIGNPSTIPFWQRIVMFISEGGKIFILRSGYLNYHVLHIILTTKLQYTFVTNKFISINFLFSLINSSSLIIRLMNNNKIILL